MGAVSVRLRWLLRRHWVATIGFALAAGLASGLSLAAWDAARRTDQVFDHFLAATDSPELDVTFCPPGVTSIEDADVDSCLQYDQLAERDVVRRLPEVAAARPRRGAHRGGGPRRRPRPGGRAGGLPLRDARSRACRRPSDDPSWSGGRLAEADAPDEVMVNEAFLRQYDVDLGDRLRLQAFAAGETEETPVDQRRSPAVEARIVGVVRTLQDLSAANDGGQAKVSASIFTRPGVDRRMEHAAAFFSAVLVQARDGDATSGAGRDRPGVPGPAGQQPVRDRARTTRCRCRDAYHYEAQAALAVAVLTALAALVFVGQALARQVRREWADAGVLRSIGLSPRQAALAAAGRGLIIGVGAALVAGAVAIGLSPVAPIGHARQGALDRGVHVDPVVLGVGLPVLVLVVVLVSAVPAWRLAAAHRRRRRGRPLRRLPTSNLSPSMAAGLGMAANGGRDGVGLPVGTAMAGVVLAASVLVVAPGSWPACTTSSPRPPATGRRGTARSAGSSRASRRACASTSARWTASSAPRRCTAPSWSSAPRACGPSPWNRWTRRTPAVAPTITRGREPLRASEIALGDLTPPPSPGPDRRRGAGRRIRRRSHPAAPHHRRDGGHQRDGRGQPRPRRRPLARGHAPASPPGPRRPTSWSTWPAAIPVERRWPTSRPPTVPSCRARCSSRPCGTSTACGRSHGCWPASSPPSPPAAWPTRCSSSSGVTAGSSRC